MLPALSRSPCLFPLLLPALRGTHCDAAVLDRAVCRAAEAEFILAEEKQRWSHFARD